MPSTSLACREQHTAALDFRLEMPVCELSLAVRTANCLEEHGVYTVEDLLNCEPDTLLGFVNFGKKTLEEVYAALEETGFSRAASRR